jgi:hypothetical protein
MSPADFLRFLGFKGKPKAVRSGLRSGWTVTTGPYGELVHADTLTCVHCQHTWEYVQGSGRRRGWCLRCHGVTCGAAACMACVPVDRRLENAEAGRPILTPRPDQVSVPRLIVPGE